MSNIKAIEEEASVRGLRCILCIHVLNSMEHLAPRWAVLCVCVCTVQYRSGLLGLRRSELNSGIEAQEMLDETKLFIGCDNCSHRAAERRLTASHTSSSI